MDNFVLQNAHFLHKGGNYFFKGIAYGIAVLSPAVGLFLGHEHFQHNSHEFFILEGADFLLSAAGVYFATHIGKLDN